jgi:hypothetical protein
MRKNTYSMMRNIFHDAMAKIVARARATFDHVKVIRVWSGFGGAAHQPPTNERRRRRYQHRFLKCVVIE